MWMSADVMFKLKYVLLCVARDKLHNYDHFFFLGPSFSLNFLSFRWRTSNRYFSVWARGIWFLLRYSISSRQLASEGRGLFSYSRTTGYSRSNENISLPLKRTYLFQMPLILPWSFNRSFSSGYFRFPLMNLAMNSGLTSHMVP